MPKMDAESLMPPISQVPPFLSTFLEQLLNGVTIGVIYSLMGVGLNLIFGMMSIVNFAHGECYMIGAYIFYVFSMFMGLNPLLAMLLAVVVSFGVGIVIERTVLRPIYKLERVDAVMYSCYVTFGLEPFLENLALLLFGPFNRKPPVLTTGSVNIFGLVYSAERLVAFAIGVVVIFAVFYTLRRSVFGRAVRAIVQNRDAAQLMGINVQSMNMIGFGIGIALTAVAGMLLTPIFVLYPAAGRIPGGKAFTVVIVGGLGSVEGAAIAGLLLGLAETFGAWGFGLGLGRWRDVFGYIIMLIVMVLRPKGIRGK